MTQTLRARGTFLVVLVFAVTVGVAVSAQKQDTGKKPSISLKATPVAGFTPLKVRVTVDVKGGANDFQDLYCPSVEWVWGDDLESSSAEDCAPYESGKSEIKRRYTVEHQFKNPGSFRIVLRLKKGSKVIGQGTAQIQVRAGLGQPEGF